MTVNDSIAPLTIGTVSFGNTGNYIDNTYYPWGVIPNTFPTTDTGWYSSGALTCSGDTHVFGCEHAVKCKCGEASRVLKPKKCGACGK